MPMICMRFTADWALSAKDLVRLKTTAQPERNRFGQCGTMAPMRIISGIIARAFVRSDDG